MSKKKDDTKAAAASARKADDAKKGNLLPNLIVAGFCIYALILAVLTVDQIFNLGLYPPKLDRMLSSHIQALGNPDLKPEEKQALADELVSYHEFSVPLLLKAVKKGDPQVKPAALRCLQEIAARFFDADIRPMGDDPAQLDAWWKDLRAKLDAAVPR